MQQSSNNSSLSRRIKASTIKVSKTLLFLMLILTNFNGYCQVIDRQYLDRECGVFNNENKITINKNDSDDDVFPITNEYLDKLAKSDLVYHEINKLFWPGLIIDDLQYFSSSNFICSYIYGVRLFEIINLEIIKTENPKSTEDELKKLIKESTIPKIFEKTLDLINKNKNDFIILKFKSHTGEVKDYIKSKKFSGDRNKLLNFNNKDFPKYRDVKGKILLILNEKPFSLNCLNCFSKKIKTIDSIISENENNFHSYYYSYHKNKFNTLESNAPKEEYSKFHENWTNWLNEDKSTRTYDKFIKYNGLIYDYNFSLETYSLNPHHRIPKIYIFSKFDIKEVSQIVIDTNIFFVEGIPQVPIIYDANKKKLNNSIEPIKNINVPNNGKLNNKINDKNDKKPIYDNYIKSGEKTNFNGRDRINDMKRFNKKTEQYKSTLN